MSRQQRRALVAAAVLLAAIAFPVLKPGDDSSEEKSSSTPTETTARSTGTTPKPTAKPRPASLRVRLYNGKPAGGIQRRTVSKGDSVVVNVTSPNTSDEVHVHGYDLHGDLAPGKPVKIPFKAEIDGIFEIELEGAKTEIAELKVEP